MSIIIDCTKCIKPDHKNFFKTMISFLNVYDSEIIRLIKAHPVNLRTPDGTDQKFYGLKIGYDGVYATLKVKDKMINITIPIVYGTKVDKYSQLYPDEIVDYEKLKNIDVALPCPFCDYEKFILPQPCMFKISGVPKYMPTFIVVDRRKPFVHKNILTWYVGGKKFVFDNNIWTADGLVVTGKSFMNHLPKLIPYLSEINDMRNQTLFSVGNMFTKLAENSILCLVGPATPFTRRDFWNSNLKDYFYKILEGRLDSAISKRTIYSNSEDSSNSHFGAGSSGQTFSEVSKQVVVHGWFQKNTRFRDPTPHSPAQQLSAIFSAFKLITASAKNSEHKCIKNSDLSILAVDYTTEGKNCGCNVSIVPGVKVSNRYDCPVNLWDFMKSTISYNSTKCYNGVLIFSDGTTEQISYNGLDLVKLIRILAQKFCLDFYLQEDVGLCGSYPGTPTSAGGQFTPTTELWLQKFNPINLLENSKFMPLDFLKKPILSLIGKSTPFIAHSNSPKVVLGNSSNKHKSGEEISTYVQNFYKLTSYQFLKKPQYIPNDLIPNNPYQLVKVLYLNYKGYNIEDGIVINKSSVENGLGECTTKTIMRISCKTILNLEPNIEFEFPVPFTIVNGMRIVTITKVGALFSYNYNLKSLPIAGGWGYEIFFDDKYETSEPISKIVESFNFSRDGDDLILNIVIVFSEKTRMGTKWTSSHGQKGIINLIEDEEKLPTIKLKSGEETKPDVIINYACFKRLTHGQTLSGLALFHGLDLTEFCGEDFLINGFKDQHKFLLEESLDSNCTVDINGVWKPGLIMMTPYSRLNQTASRSLFYTNSETRNSRCPLTNHIHRGKSKCGTLALGVMDIVNILNHGAMGALNMLHRRTNGEALAKRPRLSSTGEKSLETIELTGYKLQLF